MLARTTISLCGREGTSFNRESCCRSFACCDLHGNFVDRGNCGSDSFDNFSSFRDESASRLEANLNTRRIYKRDFLRVIDVERKWVIIVITVRIFFVYFFFSFFHAQIIRDESLAIRRCVDLIERGMIRGTLTQLLRKFCRRSSLELENCSTTYVYLLV